MKEDIIQTQIKALSKHIVPKLTPQELATFQIRPSWTHGDIEIFLNGALFFCESAHLVKVDAAGGMDDYVMGFLPKFRRKILNHTVTSHSYTLYDVQNEIHRTLKALNHKILTPNEENKLQMVADEVVKQVYGLEAKPEKYDTAQLQIINKLFCDEIAKLYNQELMNHGRRK